MVGCLCCVSVAASARGLVNLLPCGSFEGFGFSDIK